MGKANGLSKRPDWKVGVEKDNDNQVFIKDCWLCSLQEVAIEGPEVAIEGPEVDIVEKARSKNEVVKVVEKIKKTGVKVL